MKPDQKTIDILTLLSRGLTQKEISAEVNLPGPTIKWKIRNVMMKLKVKNSTELVAVAIQKGMITPISESA